MISLNIQDPSLDTLQNPKLHSMQCVCFYMLDIIFGYNIQELHISKVFQATSVQHQYT